MWTMVMAITREHAMNGSLAQTPRYLPPPQFANRKLVACKTVEDKFRHFEKHRESENRCTTRPIVSSAPDDASPAFSSNFLALSAPPSPHRLANVPIATNEHNLRGKVRTAALNRRRKIRATKHVLVAVP